MPDKDNSAGLKDYDPGDSKLQNCRMIKPV